MRIPLSGLLALAVVAPAASANTYCVSKPGCNGIDKATVEAARVASIEHPGLDRVEIGVGTFVGPKSSWGAANNPVDLVGAGRGQTFIDGANAVAGLAVIDLIGPDARVSDLTAMINGGTNRVGISLYDGSTAERVGVGVADSDDRQDLGIALRHGATVRDAIVRLNPSTRPINTGIGVYSQFMQGTPTRPAILKDVDVAAGYGIEVLDFPLPVTVARARIAAGVYGMRVESAGNLTVDNLFARLGGASSGTGVVSVRSELYQAPTKLTLRHATLINELSGGQGLDVYGVNGQPIDIAARETAISAKGSDVLLRGTAIKLGFAYSAFDPYRIARDDNANQAVTLGQGNQNAFYAPMKLGADGRPGAGSSLIDNGAPGPLDAGQSATDASGAPRLTDGDADGTARRDIGAVEAAAKTSPEPAEDVTLAPGALGPASALPPAPRSAITKATRRAVRGTARYAATVRVAVMRGCRYLTAKGTFKTAGRSCAPRFELAATGTSAWKLELPKRLPKGRYVIASRALSGGAQEKTSSRAAGNRKVLKVS